MEFNVEQFLKATGATVLGEGQNKKCLGLSTDTRTLQAGELFFALKGPHFDGHKFCEEALAKRAWGLVTSDQGLVAGHQSPVTSPSWIFQVPDTLRALGDLALWWRSQFNIPCVAITGSNGKTTTKEMTAAIAATQGDILKTEGNFNNLIGLPLTLNRLGAAHKIAILEMGMNAAGEIFRLAEIANPTVGAITNAAAAHLEKLHTVEEVAKAKTELYDGMSPEAIAVYNAEDVWLSKLVKKFKGGKISFGMQSGCDVRFEHMESQGFDSMELKLSVQGKSLAANLKTTGTHNVMNAMTACAIALASGIPLSAMKKGLENFVPLKMRFEQIQLSNGVRLVNDAYNANPFSMEAAFRTVGAAKRAGKFIAVLGDMKELGEKSAKLHQEVGKKVIEYGATQLFVIGDFAKEMAKGARQKSKTLAVIHIAKNMEDLIDSLIREMRAGDVVLVKASRAMQLEKVAEVLKEKFGI